MTSRTVPVWIEGVAGLARWSAFDASGGYLDGVIYLPPPPDMWDSYGHRVQADPWASGHRAWITFADPEPGIAEVEVLAVHQDGPFRRLHVSGPAWWTPESELAS